MRIDLAYCMELDRVVNIEEAREAFFDQSEHAKFHFLCSDKKCRYSNNTGVKVTAVNHNRTPEIDTIFISPHFRKWDEHTSDCIWLEFTKAEESVKEEDRHNDKKSRTKNQLNSPIIEEFFIPPTDMTSSPVENQNSELTKISQLDDKSKRKAAMMDYIRHRGATSRSLEHLVSCFEELKNMDALDESINVHGEGTTTFRQLFTRFTYFNGDGSFHIYYGGAKLTKRYGKNGFSLYFFDKFNGLPLSLYASHDTASQKGYRMITDIVDRLADSSETLSRPYVNVYWIGGIESNGNKASVVVRSPRHLVLRFVLPANHQTNNVT